VRYFIVEVITAFLFLFLYSRFGLTIDFFRFAFFFALLVVVSFIDIEYHAIPVQLCFIGIIVGILFTIQETIVLFDAGYRNSLPLFESFKGLIFGLGFTYLFKFFGDVLLSLYLSFIKKESIEGETEALGLGDVDFMGLVGVFLGAKLVVTTFFIAPFIALIYSIIAIVFKKSHLIPYLPYLSLGALISFLWGSQILAYFSIF
jgi:leader peptidase (prepilin peptidase)/N-methyltransferase